MERFDQPGTVGFSRRFYDPTLQRFLSQDPIGELGGLNLYGFVGNSPLNRADPYGLAYGDWYDPRTYFGNPPGVTMLPNGDMSMPGPVNPANSMTYGGMHGIDLSITGGQLPGDFIADRAVEAAKNSALAMSMLTPLGEEEGAAEAAGGLKGMLGKLWNKCKNLRGGAKPALQAGKMLLREGEPMLVAITKEGKLISNPDITCYELIWHRTFAPIGIVAFLPNSRARVEFCSRIAALGS
jgi:RHS repeat-associated protein